jgi:hypothetical protein
MVGQPRERVTFFQMAGDAEIAPLLQQLGYRVVILDDDAFEDAVTAIENRPSSDFE